jgi:acetolactate decarboxylase
MTMDVKASLGQGVRWAGAQRDVLGGDISGRVDLAELTALPDLYGLGPLEGVRGEVTIVRGVPSIARIDHDRVMTSEAWNVRACFLVWTQVSVWHTRVQEDAAVDLEGIEHAVVALAREQGIDVSRPFPFFVHGVASAAVLHVLDKRDGLPHTPERHEQAKVRQRLAGIPVELIGFHSRRHHGVFIPKDSNVHAHARTSDRSVSGHVETIRLAPGARISVPAAGWVQ